MEHKHLKQIPSHLIPIVVMVLAVLLVAGLVGGYFLTRKVGRLGDELASTTAALAIKSSQFSQSITDLQARTAGLTNILSSTQENIDAVKNQVGGVEQTVGSISGTVGTLQKLSQIDPELLKKYSKVYFMNENYVPAHLTDVPAVYLYNETRPERFLTEAWSHLKTMLDSAKAAGVTLYVKSAYRSFAEQQSIKSAYSVIYGAGTANSFSAEQGYSEHQLGTTLDVITPGLNGELNESFDQTAAYRWLVDNAHRFGFVLSYPKANGYYVYEPWHWRFVGVKLATSLHDSKLNFYSVDQRDIDAFLVNIFD